MIHSNVYSPILFFTAFLFLGSCTNALKEDGKNYKAMYEKAEFYNDRVQWDSAYYYYNRAKEYCSNEKGEEYTYAMLQIANIQRQVGDFNGSEETVTEALANYEGSVYKPYLYNLMAVNYDSQGRLDDALEYYKNAYSTFEHSSAKILAQNNIGLIYQEKDQHEKALQLLKPLLQRTSQKNDYALILSNLGYSQFKLKLPEAYSNLLKSLWLSDSLKIEDVGITTNLRLSEFFMDSDIGKSKQYALNALDAAKRTQKTDQQLKALQILTEISEGSDVKKYYVDYLKLSTSLNRIRNSAKNQFAKFKYDYKKANENEKKYKNRMQLAFLTVALIACFTLLIFWFIRKRNRKRLEASVYETEHRIAKKIHDELANDVFQAMHYAENQNLQNPSNRDVLIENLDAIYTKARDIARSNSEIKVDESFGNNLSALLNSFNNSEVNTILKNATVIDWSKINKEIKYAVYRVIQELLVNMKKHSEATLVVLSFEDTAKFLRIKYSDNGKGIDPDTFSKKGLLNAENRINVLKGTVTFDLGADKGFKVTIQIPK